MRKECKQGAVLGIDLGTTNSVVAIYESDACCKIVPNSLRWKKPMPMLLPAASAHFIRLYRRLL